MDRHSQAMAILKKGTVIPAIPLSLNRQRKFNEEGQRLLARYYLNAGVGGIAIAVHTTQFEIRLPEFNLFEPVIKIVSEEMDRYEKESGRTVVKVAGVCGEVEQAVREATLLKSYGYDAVLLSPGGLGHLSEEALLERTRAVAAVLPVIGFYLQTAVGGRRLSYAYWQQLCEIENVVAIKCAAFNRYQTLDVVRAAALSSRAEEITLYTGNDDNIVLDLLTEYKFNEEGVEYRKSFEGGLLGHWSVWTHTVVKQFEEIKKADADKKITAELLTLAAEITDANAALFDVANQFKGCIAGLHEILRRQGLMEGIWCLNPEEGLSQGQLEEIDRVCRMYPHLNDDAFVQENIDKWK